MTDTAHTERSAPPNTALKPLPRRRFFSDMPDKGLFAIAAIGGFVGIFYMKTHDWPARDVAIIAVLAMLVYGAVAYRIPLVQMRLDRLGDNFYYLGFIYTLASLSAALMQLNNEIDVQPLLGSFGIALITTIFGISGRVLLLQLRSGLDDIEQRAREELSATSERLRVELGQSILEFQTFRTAMLQVLAETQDAYDKQKRRQIEQAEALSKAMAAQTEQAVAANERHAQAIANALVSVNRAAEQATQRLSAIELPTERLESDLSSFSSTLRDQLSSVARTVEEVARQALRPRTRWRFWSRG